MGTGQGGGPRWDGNSRTAPGLRRRRAGGAAGCRRSCDAPTFISAQRFFLLFPLPVLVRRGSETGSASWPGCKPTTACNFSFWVFSFNFCSLERMYHSPCISLELVIFSYVCGSIRDQTKVESMPAWCRIRNENESSGLFTCEKLCWFPSCHRTYFWCWKPIQKAVHNSV